MVRLTREQILGADDRRTQEVEVPEWGGTVLISTMDGTTRDRWERSLLDNAEDNLRARFVAFICVEPEFTPRDVEQLAKRSGTALDRVVKAGQQLNALGGQSFEDAKGNSEPDPNADSTST